MQNKIRKRALENLNRQWKNRGDKRILLLREVIKELFETYAWNVALYGCEAWTIGKRERRRLEAFGMWCYSKLLQISWVDMVINEEVLNLVKEKRSLYSDIKGRGDRLIGHT